MRSIHASKKRVFYSPLALTQHYKEAAEAYRAASDEERRKIESLLNLKLRSTTRSQVSIKTYMDEVSRKAEERGLTPEILESLLNEEEAVLRIRHK